jgi:Holliday junction resolvase RusA-like endonuclease
MWRSVVIKGAVRVLLSAEGRQYKQDVAALWLQRPVAARKPFDPATPLALTLQWHRGRKSGDLDNRIKSATDSLKGLAFVDDAQIAEIHATRHESPRDPYLLVTIQPIDA